MSDNISKPDFALSEPYRKLRERYTDAMYRLSNIVGMKHGDDIHEVVDKIVELVEYLQGIIEALTDGVEVDLDSGDTLLIKLIDTPDDRLESEDDEDE